MACLLQVNVAGEDTKAGVGRGEVEAFLAEVEPLDHVVFHGLMTMPPFDRGPGVGAAVVHRAARAA